MALNLLPYYALLFKLQLKCVLLYDVHYCKVPIGDFGWNVHGSAYLQFTPV